MDLNKKSEGSLSPKKISSTAVLALVLLAVSLLVIFSHGETSLSRYMPLVLVVTLVLFLDDVYLKGAGLRMILTPVLGLSLTFILWGVSGLFLDLSDLVPLGILAVAGSFLCSMAIFSGIVRNNSRELLWKGVSLPVLVLTVSSVSSVFLFATKDGKTPPGGFPTILAGVFLLIVFVCMEHMIPEDEEQPSPLVDGNPSKAEPEPAPKPSQPVSRTIPDEEYFMDVKKLANLVERIVTYLVAGDKYLNPDMDVNTICRDLQTNKTYVYKAVTMFSGDNLSHFIRRLRHKYVITKLRSDRSLLAKDCWKEAGFRSYRAFLHVFREFENMSPAEWRAREDGYTGQKSPDEVLANVNAGLDAVSKKVPTGDDESMDKEE